MRINIPNVICLIRVLLAFFAFYFFYNDGDHWIFFYLTITVIVLDGLDGIAARALNQCTDFGAKLDIYCDRVIELSYWLFFAWVEFLPYWIFLFFLVRGIAVDYLATMQQDKPLGESFLRSSRFMRFAYGFLKLASFAFVILQPGAYYTNLVVYLTVFVCALRAYPVLKTLL